jgi:protein-S-isoprenylcysteine O-methyltransferase Ste14
MIRSRQLLGKNWSGNVILQKEHSLTTEGLYKIVRHPIYSGGLLAMLGSAIVLGQIFGFAWIVFSTLGLTRKIKQEEKLLEEKFPIEYSRPFRGGCLHPSTHCS